MIIRPVALSDLAALKEIAVESGPGFTSLVDDHDFLVQKIERSVASFARKADRPGHESYLFVLIDPDSKEIMGTTGIEASVGVKRPLYHYRVGQAVRRSDQLGLSSRQETLSLCTHYSGCSEICTLFLRPRFRRVWAGKLLSRVRFLFMAQHPERFAETVIAEMRGVSNATGESPFWNWLQAHFVDLDFATVSQMVGSGDNGFIADIMPQHPLYTRLMDPAANSVIGEVHPDTQPALHMLKTEGFRFTGFVDPFDGGPTVEAQVQSLRSVSGSAICQVRIRDDVAPSVPAWTNGGQGRTLMVANTATSEFRATVTSAARHLPAHQLLEVPKSLAATLGLEDGGQAWFSDLESGSRSQYSAFSATGRHPLNTKTPPGNEASNAH